MKEVVVQMRKLKNEPDYSEADDKAIVKTLIAQSQNGNLYGRDITIAEEINDTVWGQDSITLKDYQAKDISECLEANKDKLMIHVHQSLLAKTSSLLLNLTMNRAVVICGPSLSGKSTMIQVFMHVCLN